MKPKDYAKHERATGCYLTTQLNFRMSQVMANHLREYARLKGEDISVCARTAIFNFLAAEGMDALSVLPQSPK